MTAQELLSILQTAEVLKCTTRHCVTSSGRKESVAEHCWRTALMAMLLREEFPQANMDKVIQMCLIHDMGEAFTGDIPCFEKTRDHVCQEEAQLQQWIADLPQPLAQNFSRLYQEMEAMQTQEAKIYKALDKLEAVIQHNESDIATWLPLEYDLQLTYGQENVAFSPLLQSIKEENNRITQQKIKTAKKAME